MVRHDLYCLACQARESGNDNRIDKSITEIIPLSGRSMFLHAFGMLFSRFMVIRREAKGLVTCFF